METVLNQARCRHDGCSARVDHVGPVGNIAAVGWYIHSGFAETTIFCPAHRPDGIACETVAGSTCGICKGRQVALLFGRIL